MAKAMEKHPRRHYSSSGRGPGARYRRYRSPDQAAAGSIEPETPGAWRGSGYRSEFLGSGVQGVFGVAPGPAGTPLSPVGCPDREEHRRQAPLRTFRRRRYQARIHASGAGVPELFISMSHTPRSPGLYSTHTVGTFRPVTGLLTPPIRRVTGSASPFKCVPGMRQLIW
jgi:hypothetical protein